MSRGVLGLFLLSVAACSSKADAPTADAPPTTPSDGTTTSTLPTSTPSTTDSAPLTDTWPWPTRFPTADTAGSGQRSACDPGDLSPLPPPPVVPGEALSGCLAGLSRTELVKPLTLASADVSPLGPGSGACLYDQLSFQVSSEPTATLPDAVSLVSWDLTTGTRRGATPLVLDGLADQLLDATAPGLCDPTTVHTLVTGCDGNRFRPRGVGVGGGAARWTTGAGLFEVSVPWDAEVDEVWVWVLVERYQLALGPWPAMRDGADWVLEKSWLSTGLATDGDEVQVGLLGCRGGQPVTARAVP